jgi:hypothetical protein
MARPESAGIWRPGVLEVRVTLGDLVVGSLRARSVDMGG